MLVAALAGLLAAAAALTPGASAAAGRCSYPLPTTPFAQWSDTASYTLVSGGSFEQAGTAGWSVVGARIVAGNESFYVHAAGDKKSLSLPDLSTATTPALCVSEETPSIRLLVTNDGNLASPLTVDLGVVANKRTSWTRLATLLASAPGWAPSPIVDLALPASALSSSGTAKVVIRFTAQGGGGAWRIDDLYLDPFKRK
jgi:hypothetical protein